MKNRISLIPTQRPAIKMTHSIIQREKKYTNPNPLTNVPYTQTAGISHSKIKWKEVMNINTDLYSKANNLLMINHCLTNLITSNIIEEDVTSVPEGNIVKLIRIYQHTINILLSSNQHIESSYASLGQQYNALKNNNTFSTDESHQSNKDLIKLLKKKNTDNEKLITTYKAIITCLQREKDSNNKINQSQSKEDESAKQTFFCHYCTGKKYFTEGELKNHLLKRHLMTDSQIKESTMQNNNTKSMGMSMSMSSDKDCIDLFDKKIIDLKKHFEDYFVHLKSEGNMMDLDNQRKIEEERQKRELDYIESKFVETLNEIKEYYLHSTYSKPQPVIIQHQYIANDSSNKNEKEMISTMILNEFNKLNDNIDYMSFRSNKINYVEEEFKDTTKSILKFEDDNEKRLEGDQIKEQSIIGRYNENDNDIDNDNDKKLEVNELKQQSNIEINDDNGNSSEVNQLKEQSNIGNINDKQLNIEEIKEDINIENVNVNNDKQLEVDQSKEQINADNNNKSEIRELNEQSNIENMNINVNVIDDNDKQLETNQIKEQSNEEKENKDNDNDIIDEYEKEFEANNDLLNEIMNDNDNDNDKNQNDNNDNNNNNIDVLIEKDNDENKMNENDIKKNIVEIEKNNQNNIDNNENDQIINEVTTEINEEHKSNMIDNKEINKSEVDNDPKSEEILQSKEEESKAKNVDVLNENSKKEDIVEEIIQQENH